MLHVIGEHIPDLTRTCAGTGRKPYQYIHFVRSFLAGRYFGIEKPSQLIQSLKREPNLRLLCGFKRVPDKVTFSRALAFLSEQDTPETTLDGIVAITHKNPVVYHVNRGLCGDTGT
jgi:hypothetical protein